MLRRAMSACVGTRSSERGRNHSLLGVRRIATMQTSRQPKVPRCRSRPRVSTITPTRSTERLEEYSRVRHEYLNGDIRPLWGNSVRHAALASVITMSLGSQLADGPCGVFGSDLQIRADGANANLYPDLSVICGRAETDGNNDHAAVNPTAVVEVLSPSTANWDRGGKLDIYKTIPSLRAVVLVWQSERRIEVHSRDDSGSWRSVPTLEGGSAQISCIDCVLDVDAIYDRVDTQVPAVE